MQPRVNVLNLRQEKDSQAEVRRELRKLAEQILKRGNGEKQKTLKLLEKYLEYPFEVDVLKAMFSLSQQLISRSDSFDTIIGDEGSGHLIALMLKEVFDRERVKRGQEKIPITFLLGGLTTDGQEKKVNEFVGQHQAQLSRALIVTEYILSGRGMVNLLKSFSHYGLTPVLAAATTQYEKKDYAELFGVELVIGTEESGAGLNLYSKPALTGVQKRPESPGPHAEAYKKLVSQLGLKKEIQREVNFGRDQVFLIAEVFYGLLQSK